MGRKPCFPETPTRLEHFNIGGLTKTAMKKGARTYPKIVDFLLPSVYKTEPPKLPPKVA